MMVSELGWGCAKIKPGPKSWKPGRLGPVWSQPNIGRTSHHGGVIEASSGIAQIRIVRPPTMGDDQKTLPDP